MAAIRRLEQIEKESKQTPSNRNFGVLQEVRADSRGAVLAPSQGLSGVSAVATTQPAFSILRDEETEEREMKIYDTVKKEDVEIADYKELIKIMQDGRQVDLYLKEKKSDEDGYMTWDVEHWSSIAPKRFIRCYSLEGRVLGESTGHNIYDLDNAFKPEEAAKIELS